MTRWDDATMRRAARADVDAMSPAQRLRREERMGMAAEMGMDCGDQGEAAAIANVNALLPDVDHQSVPLCLEVLERVNGRLRAVGARPLDPKTGLPMSLPDAVAHMARHGAFILFDGEDDFDDGTSVVAPQGPKTPKGDAAHAGRSDTRTTGGASKSLRVSIVPPPGTQLIGGGR